MDLSRLMTFRVSIDELTNCTDRACDVFKDIIIIEAKTKVLRGAIFIEYIGMASFFEKCIFGEAPCLGSNLGDIERNICRLRHL